jgi:hypothetical protein
MARIIVKMDMWAECALLLPFSHSVPGILQRPEKRIPARAFGLDSLAVWDISIHWPHSARRRTFFSNQSANWGHNGTRYLSANFLPAPKLSKFKIALNTRK